MPAFHHAQFKVRHYECDAYGHLNNVNYVRYMQEAALEASAAVGWDAARYRAAGYLWLARETEIEYLQPFLQGATVEIKTWAEDFRRVRSRRVYEFRQAGSPTLHAHATTDWVFLEAATSKPTTIPAEIVQAYAPDGLPPNSTPREKFPASTARPAEVYRLRKRIEWRDIDTEGHANNAAYFSLIEDTSTQVGRHFGWSMPRMLAAGVVMVMRRLRVVYLQPAQMDDEVEIAAWLSDPKRISVTRHYHLTRLSDGVLLAQAQGLWVCFDLKQQRPIRIPQQMAQDFAANMVATED
jgi:acyl-CoA thioester hydrolase